MTIMMLIWESWTIILTMKMTWTMKLCQVRKCKKRPRIGGGGDDNSVRNNRVGKKGGNNLCVIYNFTLIFRLII